MRTSSLTWTGESGWTSVDLPRDSIDLVLYFGARDALSRSEPIVELSALCPTAIIVGCSTGGQIVGLEMREGGIDAVAIAFDRTDVRLASAAIDASDQSHDVGKSLGHSLASPHLNAVLVFSDGLKVNGSALVDGILAGTGPGVAVAGGLAGDDARFETTLVGVGGRLGTAVVAAIGLYGDAIRLGFGSAGGWNVFGPRRKITKSSGNVVFELDGEPALDLYERYLGPEEVEGLPSSALLFPLQIRNPSGPGPGVVRTVLAVDRAERSMTFAGDMPEGWISQLMRGTHEGLVEGAAVAAKQASTELGMPAELSILVSCIGRKLLMGQRIGDELEAASEELGGSPTIGFYSYGEISPLAPTGFSELHNQTMTVMTLSETAA